MIKDEFFEEVTFPLPTFTSLIVAERVCIGGGGGVPVAAARWEEFFVEGGGGSTPTFFTNHSLDLDDLRLPSVAQLSLDV